MIAVGNAVGYLTRFSLQHRYAVMFVKMDRVYRPNAATSRKNKAWIREGLWPGRSELCGAEVGAGAPHPTAGAAVEDVGVPASRDDRFVCRVPDSEDHLGILSERPRPG
jgi:hypothetical protein